MTQPKDPFDDDTMPYDAAIAQQLRAQSRGATRERGQLRAVPSGGAELATTDPPSAVMDSKPRVWLRNHPNETFLDRTEVEADAGRQLGARVQEVYQRDGELVDAGPLDIYVRKDGSKRVTEPRLGIRTLPLSEVQAYLEQAAEFWTWQFVPAGGAWTKKRTEAPLWLATRLANKGRWQHIRPLRGVLTAPSLRPDGSYIDAPGWDEATDHLLAPKRSFPPLPAEPTIDDARKALARLRLVFSRPGDGFEGFPFPTEADQLVPIAAVLTILARPAIDGPVPAFVFDASTAGTGKTLLADTVCLIATGETAPKCPFPAEPEELEKQLGAMAIAGMQVCGFDNLDGRHPLRGAALDRTLTSTRVQFRLLGRSEMLERDWRAVVIATGNNVAIQGDTLRRCLRSRQEPDCEHPEERQGFRIENLPQYAREHRGELVRDCLTLLRAFFVAGQPKSGGGLYGSFTAWQRVVSDALFWASGIDILQCRTDRVDIDDPELDAAQALFRWLEAFGQPITASELLKRAYAQSGGDYGGIPEDTNPELREALETLCPSKGGKRPLARVVGITLRRWKGRVFGGQRLDLVVDASGGSNAAWVVRPARGKKT